ncbi:MAG: hypothetical protein MK108_17705 [Mariniblastus sp.]|nr:hypothetical protein [Mariniblastus sp.]
MAYPWIHWLASLLFASSLNLPLPPAGTQVDDNLIQSTIISLNRQVSQALDTETFEQPAKSSLRQSSNDDHPADKVITKLRAGRAGQPSGCLIVRIDLTPDNPSPAGVKATLVSARKTVKRTGSPAPSGTVQPGCPPSGCYLFRIERVVSVETGPAFDIDPRILPNYQFIPDPYWQYYSDCDQWNIVFTAPEGAPAVSGPVNPNQGLASFLTDPRPLLREWLATRTDWPALTEAYQISIRPVLEQFTDSYSAELTGNKLPSGTRLDSGSLQSGKQSQSGLATCWSSIATHWMLKEAMETELIHSPNAWLNHKIDVLDRSYGETLPGTMVRQWTRSVKKEMQIKRKKQSESEMKRGFATRINWLSIQLKRVANAMDEAAEHPQEVIRENDKPTHY